jgi:hypothetical protein
MCSRYELSREKTYAFHSTFGPDPAVDCGSADLAIQRGVGILSQQRSRSDRADRTAYHITSLGLSGCKALPRCGGIVRRPSEAT